MINESQKKVISELLPEIPELTQNGCLYLILPTMQALCDYLNQYISSPVTDEAFAVIKCHFTPKKIRKKQYFLQAGEICKHMAFIEKGAMRKFYIDEKGVEHVVDLGIENWWAGDWESFVMLTPTIYHIEAWEDAEMLLYIHGPWRPGKYTGGASN